MSSSRYFIRRFKRITSSSTIQLLTICFCAFLAIRWVIRHNHDDDNAEKYKTLAISVDTAKVDWFKLYYVQYVTTEEELCNALIVWSEIEEIGSRAQRMMFYPADWDLDEKDTTPSKPDELTARARLLRTAKRAYFVKLTALDVLGANHPERSQWVGSYTKLLAFGLVEWDRVLVISPDSTVLNNLDELFLFPSAPIAMPYIYRPGTEPTSWTYSSQLLLVEPNEKLFEAVKNEIKEKGSDGNDMDILSSLTSRKPLRIPQRPYHFPTSEFRQHTHTTYLTTRNSSDTWDPERIMDEAKVLQFDDSVPKPWIKAKQGIMNSNMPICRERDGFGATDCRDRAKWLGVYETFQLRRESVCGVGFEVRGEVDEDRGWDGRLDMMVEVGK
ncbi:Nucleotide-diphospho-sugar transferase [Glarea lozoyensis ATCC 20868]|uniref:Nucleotide-diphospho-sugar transferase n=1 Tax=Glarea lozoyensis (strain ATCC 20868 / MF5171) TaxID=1116229 RepID=S3DBI4_GLAL2|nr:Nucleotide-diphospho-sugar transferase [Glarea lozoyensis ATCC 20868]EPE35105.1 Nucleotide-diphospho-sugar transferase [Glarea lozoyensis ATCC 20868]